MSKIHPETKVLIIKRLKTRSTADVADTFNVSQRQVQRIKKDLKRLETFLTSPGQADPCSRGPFVGSKIQGQPIFHCSRAPRDLVT
ncbi:hypothetical protein QQF64_009439 [Cirrhinus molitorella]|uniref:Transposase n=1 Tax=Cirrhinus molitorella TaxID=172907 RepID=A0ABR3M153_9TELE